MESQKPMAPKPAATVSAKVKKEEKISNIRGIRNAFAVIIACAFAAVCIFLFGMGYSGNFEGYYFLTKIANGRVIDAPVYVNRY